MIRNDNYNNKGEKVMSLKDKAVWLNGSDYIELDSVGSTLTSELKVIPITEYLHSVDENMAVHIYDLDDEWYNSLSSDDLTDFFEFVESNSDVVTIVYNAWKDGIWGDWETVNNCYMNMDVI
jgi:hypothetical protein